MGSDFTFVLHCSNCGINGEIDEYISSCQCPECQSEMKISYVKLNVPITHLHSIVSDLLFKKKQGNRISESILDLLINSPDTYVRKMVNELVHEEEIADEGEYSPQSISPVKVVDDKNKNDKKSSTTITSTQGNCALGIQSITNYKFPPMGLFSTNKEMPDYLDSEAIPNRASHIVYIRSLMETELWRKTKGTTGNIPLILGKNAEDETVIINLVKSPNLLITGGMESGVSVCVNTLLMSILHKFTPHNLRLILIDLKRVDFSVYKPLPHLMIPVIDDPHRVLFALHLVNDKMEYRYKLLSHVNAKNLYSFNSRSKSQNPDFDEEGNIIPEELPQFVIIVNELEDLMMSDDKDEIEKLICQIARRGHTVGIHCIITTQAPRRNVVTELIRNYFLTRISFRLNSIRESQFILGTEGAEKLLGKGDMLIKENEDSTPERVQGAMIFDSEIQKVVDFISPQYPQQFDGNMTTRKAMLDGDSIGDDSNVPYIDEDMNVCSMCTFSDKQIRVVMQKYIYPEDSDLIRKALEIILRERRISTSYLQRRLGIGYNKATDLISEFEKRGIVSPTLPGGSKRDVLILDELLNATNDAQEVSCWNDTMDEVDLQIVPSSKIDSTLNNNHSDEDHDNKNTIDREPGDKEKQEEIESKIYSYSDTSSIDLAKLMHENFSQKQEIPITVVQNLIENKSSRNYFFKRLQKDNYISVSGRFFQKKYIIKKRIPLWKFEEIFHNIFIRETKPNLLFSIFGILWWARYIIITVFAIYCIYSMIQGHKNDPVYKEIRRRREMYGDKLDVRFYARESLKEILKSPSSVVFHDDEFIDRNCIETHSIIRKENLDPEKTWYVVGSFDAQNSFGAMIRSRYGAVIVYEGNGRYKTISVGVLDL